MFEIHLFGGYKRPSDEEKVYVRLCVGNESFGE